MACVFVAPEGFADDLRRELELEEFRVGNVRERLVFAEWAGPGAPPPVAWAQNSWLDARTLDCVSIGQAARSLRELAPGPAHRWHLHPVGHHRRAALVQGQVSGPKIRKWKFLEPMPEVALGGWTMLEPQLLCASPRCSSPLPDGEITFEENKVDPPSRAYLKLWELFTVYGFSPRSGERCLDLGSCPGGWTWVLAQLGCQVTGVDRAPFHPSLVGNPRVTHLKRDAFGFSPADAGPVDWVFCDIIAYPQKTLELVRAWMGAPGSPKLVFTVKFRGPTDFDVLRALKAIPGSRLVHLHHNKHELTWFRV